MRASSSSNCGAFIFSSSSSTSPSSTSSYSNRNRSRNRPLMASSLRIAVVGDVHDEWNFEQDSKALRFLQADLVLFTGDFGNENVELVRSIASLEIAKAVILGNHDCWTTQQFSQNFSLKQYFSCTKFQVRKDRVQLQLDCLGQEHVGYRYLDFPALKLSVVGGRPFSHGGSSLFRKSLLSARYGVNDLEGSAKRIYNTATRTPEGHSVIILAHNGPTGLGDQINDICGRDWVPEGGDHGDPDLAQALSDLKENTRISIPLVVFGHMHKELAYRKGVRKMIVVGEDGIVYLNGAIVPRVKSLTREQQETSICSAETNGTVRAFTLVDFSEGNLTKVTETWVLVVGDETRVEEEDILDQDGT